MYESRYFEVPEYSIEICTVVDGRYLVLWDNSPVYVGKTLLDCVEWIAEIAKEVK